MTFPTILVNDDAIWLKSIDADANLIALLGQLEQGTPVYLEIEGGQLRFEKMRDGRDGRPTPGLKPVGESRDVWKRFRDTRRGERLAFRVVEQKSTYLNAVQTVLTEWDSASDDEAFRDL